MNIRETPTFSIAEADELLQNLFGVRGELRSFPSERDQNFHVIASSGEEYVLKIANIGEQREMLEAEIAAIEHLSRNLSNCQRIVPTLNGKLLSEFKAKDGKTYFIRLLTFLPGATLAKVKRHSPELLEDLGRCSAEMDAELEGFDHTAAHRDFYWDLAIALRTISRYRELVTNQELLTIIDKCIDSYKQNVEPRLSKLRMSVIHNDANDYNVIVDSGKDLRERYQRVSGIIDFGDMVYSHTINNLAVTVSYAILDKPDILETASHVVRGYHAAFPLTEDEISALFDLVRMRLCLSVCVAAYQQSQRPSDSYLSISQEHIRELLPRLVKIHPKFAEAVFRQACGLEPIAKSIRVRQWLQENTSSFAPVLGKELDPNRTVMIDLGISSPLLNGDVKKNSEAHITKSIFDFMGESGADVAIGQYDEVRLLYATPEFSRGEAFPGEGRTVHIGMDFFANPGAPVCAPLAGEVVAFHYNEARLDYGNVILLKHETSSGEGFFTLYGHLSSASLRNLKIGQRISHGEQFASLGTPDENGGWTPHLHLQIVIDHFGFGCDFPGVCLPGEREVWVSLCPDPDLIVQLHEELISRRRKKKSDVLADRRKFIGRNLSIGYQKHLQIERGWMQYLYDETGRRFLDAYNNVPHVGHCHPRVVEAAIRQMRILNTNTRYLNENLQNFAEKLLATLPDQLSVCYFVNTGSEGNELAMRLSRAYTGQKDMIVLEGAYHGHTTSLIDISPYKHDGPGGKGAPEWVHVAPNADVYRGPFKADDPEAGPHYADAVQKIIEKTEKSGRGICAYIAESCPSVGGQIIFPPQYLEKVYEHVHAAGGVCIADEVQTAYGRTGTHFYAFEAQGVIPDIVVLGKPIGNGHPISAVITTPEIAAAFDNGMEFFSTFGGNTVSCAVGMAVLDIVHEEALQQHALNVGNRLLEGLKQFKGKFDQVGDVRGSGLFLGIELVRDHKTLDPATEEASYIVNRMREYGVLLGTDGPLHNVIKIRPPMPFSEENADQLIQTMERVFREDFC